MAVEPNLRGGFSRVEQTLLEGGRGGQEWPPIGHVDGPSPSRQ